MKITLKNMREVYTAEGETAREALENLPLKTLRGKSILSSGDRNLVLTAVESARLSSPQPAVQAVAIKNIAMRLT